LKIALLQASCLTMNPAICGGIERVELSELEHLGLLGHRAELFVGKLKGTARDIRRLPDPQAGGGPYYLRLAREMLYHLRFRARASWADVFHGHYTPMLPLFGGGKSIVHFHGLGINEMPGYRLFRKRYHRGHLVFCSRYVRDKYPELYPGFPQKNQHVVHNGIDVARFRPEPGRRPGRVRRIVFYGGWIPIKGIFEAVETARLLEGKRGDFEVVIGGSARGHYRDFGWADPGQMEAEVAKRSAGLRRCRFIGDIRYADLPDLLRSCDIGLMPSTYNDPFPLVTLEMMASGLPVAAFANGGVPEQVADGQTGFLVEGNSPAGLARAVERLLDDETLLARMSAAARQRTLDLFTWERHCRELEAVYSTIRRGAQ
jgi:glycosyltransferase involved in cell wall biosynthesis